MAAFHTEVHFEQNYFISLVSLGRMRKLGLEEEKPENILQPRSSKSRETLSDVSCKMEGYMTFRHENPSSLYYMVL